MGKKIRVKPSKAQSTAAFYRDNSHELLFLKLSSLFGKQ